MTKGEIKTIAEQAGIELDDEMTGKEMYKALMDGLECREEEEVVITTKSAEPDNIYDKIHEDEKRKIAVLNKKYEGKFYAGCVLGNTKKHWFRGNLKFRPATPTYFSVGSEGRGGRPITGLEIERILKDPVLVVVPLDSSNVSVDEALKMLFSAAPSQAEIFIKQTQMDNVPRVIKEASPQLQNTPPGAEFVSETTTIKKETVPIRGKAF